jgi:hypothetical protein
MCAMIPMFRVFSSGNLRGISLRRLLVFGREKGALGPQRTTALDSWPSRYVLEVSILVH